jgi:hypothetical protein
MRMRKASHHIVTFAAVAAVVTFALVAAAPMPVLAADDEKVDPFAGLKKIEDAKVGVAYVDPKADFSVFKRVAISDPYVAFRADWRRDQNRTRVRPITNSHANRIKANVADLLKEVLTERLEKDDGFEVTKEAGYDVLLVKPAIIDLDVSPPEAGVAGASASFNASTGEAVLYIELFDSVSGDILGRAADRQGGDNPHFGLSTEALMKEHARKVFEEWADTLRNFLDEHYKGE